MHLNWPPYQLILLVNPTKWTFLVKVSKFQTGIIKVKKYFPEKWILKHERLRLMEQVKEYVAKLLECYWKKHFWTFSLVIDFEWLQKSIMMMIIFAANHCSKAWDCSSPPPNAFSLICNTNHVREGHFSYALGQYQTSCQVLAKQNLP